MIADCPTLFHMAERGSWNSICEHGLLSTSALLDLYGVNGVERQAIESTRRPSSITVTSNDLPQAVIRDQIPMTDDRLRRCLPPHISPQDWYELLNQKVFFWLSRERLCRLTGGRAYRHKSHDVIELDTRSLIEAHRERIWLCPMNSGNTYPIPHPRDEFTFQRIADYPYQYWKPRRKRRERVVELAVDHSVPNLQEFVTRVVEVQGSNELQELYCAP